MVESARKSPLFMAAALIALLIATLSCAVLPASAFADEPDALAPGILVPQDGDIATGTSGTCT